jgi:hypothetical protein
VGVRVPVSGNHRLEGDVIIADPLPDSGLAAEFSFEFVADSNEPVPQLSLNIEFEILTGLDRVLLAIFNFGLFLNMLAIEEAVELIAEAILGGEVDKKLGGLRSYRFDRRLDLTGVLGGPPVIELVRPPGFLGSEDPGTPGYIDLLLVSDGCTVSNLAPFNELAMALANRFAPNSAAGPAPFLQYRSAIRIWTMTLVAENPADRLERTIFPVQTDRATLNFSNLARLAEIGLTASASFAHHPIVILLSQVSPDDRNQARVGSANIRANTQGPYVLLELPAFGPGAVDTVIHELGHTPLGRYLADEYPDADNIGGCTFGPGEKLYRGLEPRPRNVSTNPFLGWVKWQPWSGGLFDQFTNVHLGGYEHDLGVIRFADTCKMRCSDESELCPICREELALGLLEHGHLRVGISGLPGAVDLLVEYLAPWTEVEPRRLRLTGGSTVHLDVLASDATGPTTRVRLRLVGSTVPEDWDILWNVSRNAGNTYGLRTGREVEIEVRPGALLELTVRHEPPTPPILAQTRTLPETMVSLLFDAERQITASHLLPPTELRQSVTVGAVLTPEIDAATGRLSLPEPLWVEARNGGVQGFELATVVSFRVEGPRGYQLPHDSQAGPRGIVRRWNIQRVLPSGQYTWSAFTRWRAVSGPGVEAPRSAENLCWEIALIPFVDDPRPPTDPFNLQLVETATFPARPVGLQASSWHPNDLRINFQFEYKLDPQPFNEQGLLESGLQARDPGNSESVAITGRISFSLLPRPGQSGDLYRWRVRAVDEAQRFSNWVEGRPFLIYLPTGRPRDLEEMARLLEDVRVLDLLKPGGPFNVPRLFIANERDWQFLDDRPIDFARLKKIASELPPKC